MTELTSLKEELLKIAVAWAYHRGQDFENGSEEIKHLRMALAECSNIATKLLRLMKTSGDPKEEKKNFSETEMELARRLYLTITTLFDYFENAEHRDRKRIAAILKDQYLGISRHFGELFEDD